MASAAQNLMKIFRGETPGPAEQKPSSVAPQRSTRRSSGLVELSETLSSQEGLRVLDLGPTSPGNIQYLTELGHKCYSEDVLLASFDPSLVTKDEQGKRVLDEKRFLSENLVYEASLFDVVLCWNLADYLDESLVKPIVGRFWTTLKPGGMLLAFFHTRDAGPDAPCYRYHIINKDTLEMQHIVARPETEPNPGSSSRTYPPSKTHFRLQHVFNNRNIENLFRDFSSIKFFLSRDNVREVLVVR
jgi:SAM-dependent methyltransferase